MAEAALAFEAEFVLVDELRGLATCDDTGATLFCGPGETLSHREEPEAIQ